MRQLGLGHSTAVLLALTGGCALLSYARGRAVLSVAPSYSGAEWDAPSLATGGAASADAAAAAAARQYPMDEADFLVHRAYAETYGRMFPCADDQIEKQCIASVVEHLNDRNENHNWNNTETRYGRVPPSHPYPWWFRTLLRDIPSNGAYGFWHHFSTLSTSPPFRFCAIGKNGSTEWRRVFRALNAPEFCEGGKVTKECKSKFNTGTKLKEDYTPKTVFLRDPLERLLSGYLDKCAKPGIRTGEGHCEPNEIFGVDFLERKARRGGQQKQQGRRRPQGGKEKETNDEIPPDLTTVVQDMDQEMFAAYVDLLPLRWNVHFVPQAIFCDLYRTIDSYDFVGVMGKSFMSELGRMADRYGGMLPDVLDDAFRYRSSLNESAAGTNMGSEKAHGTKAPAKVAKYYSAGAVRRALEYLSVDYVTLGLKVPGWAREMLRGDAV